jgi:cell division protein FtsZ
MTIELDTSSNLTGDAKIKVVGVGGGGGNAINNMINKGLSGVDFIAANTDSQALQHNKSKIKIQLGTGLGAGANPDVARKAVEQAIDTVKDTLKGSDMVFITAGMGGGTGTGAAPTIAKVAQELGALVVGIVTKPFDWEGKRRIEVALQGIEELRQYVDALIVIPNQRVLEIIDKKTSFTEAFMKVDEVLYNATRGISDIINNYGIVNVDFADVRTIMKGMGDALMGIGTSSGENRAVEATKQALNSPLLDGISIAGAKGVLINITGGMDMGMHEISEAVSIVQQAAGDDVNLIHGVVLNPDMADQISVTVVATGFPKNEKKIDNNPKNKEQVDIFGTVVKPEIKQQPAKSIPTLGGVGIPKPNVIKAPTSPIVPKFHNIPESSPKGEKKLKEYDEPAYIRRTGPTYTTGGKLIEDDPSLNSQAASNHYTTFTNNADISQAKIISSAFLRKLTDI